MPSLRCLELYGSPVDTTVMRTLAVATQLTRLRCPVYYSAVSAEHACAWMDRLGHLKELDVRCVCAAGACEHVGVLPGVAPAGGSSSGGRSGPRRRRQQQPGQTPAHR
jgi:hypothetical protein